MRTRPPLQVMCAGRTILLPPTRSTPMFPANWHRAHRTKCPVRRDQSFVSSLALADSLRSLPRYQVTEVVWVFLGVSGTYRPQTSIAVIRQYGSRLITRLRLAITDHLGMTVLPSVHQVLHGNPPLLSAMISYQPPCREEGGDPDSKADDNVGHTTGHSDSFRLGGGVAPTKYSTSRIKAGT